MGLALDALIAILVVMCAIQGYKHGVIRTIFGVVSFLLAAVLAFLMYVPFSNFVRQTPVGQDMYNGIYESIDKNISEKWDEDEAEHRNSEDLIEEVGLPKFLRNDVYRSSGAILRNTAATAKDAVCQASSEALLRIFAAVALFFIILLALWLVRLLLEIVFKMPILKGINKQLGFILGLIKGLLYAFLLLGMITVFGNMENMGWLKEAADSSVIFRFMYQNNLLLSIFSGKK